MAVMAIGLLSGLYFPENAVRYELGAGGWVLLVIGAIMLLLSVEAIRNLKARYFRLMDSKQWGEMRAALSRALQHLTEEQQQVLLLRFVADHSTAEVARFLQKNRMYEVLGLFVLLMVGVIMFTLLRKGKVLAPGDLEMHPRTAIGIDPQNFDAHSDLGLVLMLSRQTEAAVVEWQHAARLRPNDADVWHNLGKLLGDLRQPVRARAAFERSLALKPGRVPTLTAYARMLTDCGDEDAAEAMWLRIIGLLGTMFDGRTLHDREVLQTLVQGWNDLVFHTVIRRTIKFSDSTVAGEPITSYATGSTGAASSEAVRPP